jgi:hypothetical protein
VGSPGFIVRKIAVGHDSDVALVVAGDNNNITALKVFPCINEVGQLETPFFLYERFGLRSNVMPMRILGDLAGIVDGPHFKSEKGLCRKIALDGCLAFKPWREQAALRGSDVRNLNPDGILELSDKNLPDQIDGRNIRAIRRHCLFPIQEYASAQ